MAALQLLAAEFAITVTNGAVWLAIAQGLLFGGVCLAFGIWVARTVGLLRSDAAAGETLGVGLSAGLIVSASWWAAVWSGGRSSFTPVALGFAIAIGLALASRTKGSATVVPAESLAAPSDNASAPPQWFRRKSLLLTALAASTFVVAVALLYGSTLAPSPREGVQPVEFMDQAYYSVLGRDLASTGTESSLSPSGFSELPGLRPQAWYHWAELWLASAVITIFGTAPVAARHFVVLPIVVLAAAAMTGTVVRRMVGTKSRRAYALGFLACLFLAPIPLIPGPFFSSWAVGMIYGIGFYGLAAVAVLLAFYGLVVLGRRRCSWALACFAGCATAFILPSHIVIAFLGSVGLGSVWMIEIAQSLMVKRRLPVVSSIWRRTIIATLLAFIATVVWGVLTGHDLGGSALSPNISPFNDSWAASVAIIYVGSGAFFAMALAWPSARKKAPIQAQMFAGTAILLVVGAAVWGARLGDFNMFHVFFAGIAVFATPVAAVAVWMLWKRLRETRHRELAAGLVALTVIQLELGMVIGVLRVQAFGPQIVEHPVPISLLRAIEQLPPDAKLAYSCPPWDEVAFTVPRLLSIDAHTGRRVVPMCFEADYFGSLIGGDISLEIPNTSFAWAPQRFLYPDAKATPSSTEVANFLRDNGIDYIYADSRHPNSLVSDATLVAKAGDAEILKVP